MWTIGAIFSDIVGSVHEHGATMATDFPLFTPESRCTDDTVRTVATAQALMSDEGYDKAYRRSWGCRYPHAGYGGASDAGCETEAERGNGSRYR